MQYKNLDELNDVRRRGLISEEEYQRERRRFWNPDLPVNPSPSMYWGMSENSYIALMHIAQFGGYIVPLLGFILPVVMWMQFKDQNAAIDRHGKNIVNFMISWIIYAIVAGILCLVVIGLPLLALLGISQIVFVVMAAIKAANGEYWKYPLTIDIVK